MSTPSTPDPSVSDSDDSFEQMICAARAGSSEAIGQLIESCRPYLLLIANQELESAFTAKTGASDLVQETVMSAQRCIGQFEGSGRNEILAWMRGILINDLQKTRRHYRTEQRQVGREVRMDSAAARSIDVTGIKSSTETPSTAAVAREERQLLMQAMQNLTEDDRTIIEWRNWERLSFAEIGERTGRSADAARKQWSRAINRLQQQLDPDDA